MSIVSTNYTLQQEQLAQEIRIENPAGYVRDGPELLAEINEIFKTLHTRDLSPLVEFINEKNSKFEDLLNECEQQRITENKQICNPNPKQLILSGRKNYNLRYQPYQSFQKESNLFLEQKKTILDLIRAGVTRTIIEKQYGISSKTLKEWRRLEIDLVTHALAHKE